MKYAKMLGLLAVAAAALMAFAGSASATELTTSSDGGKTHSNLAAGASIHAVNSGTITLDGSLVIECSESTIEGSVTSAGSASTTVSGAISVLSFANCGSRTITVISKGSLEAHTDETSTPFTTYGKLTSSGAEVTVLAHLPFNVTTHCIYKTTNTLVGTVTSSDHQLETGLVETPVIHVDTAAIPVVATDIGCGTSAEWTGKYEVTTPMHLDVH